MACAGCGVGRHGGRAASHTRHATVGPRKYFLRPGRQCRRLSPQATASAFSLAPLSFPSAATLESQTQSPSKALDEARSPSGRPEGPTFRAYRARRSLSLRSRLRPPHRRPDSRQALEPRRPPRRRGHCRAWGAAGRAVVIAQGGRRWYHFTLAQGSVRSSAR